MMRSILQLFTHDKCHLYFAKGNENVPTLFCSFRFACTYLFGLYLNLKPSLDRRW